MFKTSTLIVLIIALICGGCESDQDQSSDNEMMSAGEMNAGEMSAGEMNAGEMSAGEMSAGEMTQTDPNRVPPQMIMSSQDLVRAFTLIENVINHAVRVYCDECSTMTALCEISGPFTQYYINQEIAECLLAEAGAVEQNRLLEGVACEIMFANQIVDCFGMISSCGSEEVDACLQIIDSNTCLATPEVMTLKSQCFSAQGLFICDNGSLIESEFVCDGERHCSDASDETADCPAPFICDDGSDIPRSWLCDGTSDCASGVDEEPENCPMAP